MMSPYGMAVDLVDATSNITGIGCSLLELAGVKASSVLLSCCVGVELVVEAACRLAERDEMAASTAMVITSYSILVDDVECPEREFPQYYTR